MHKCAAPVLKQVGIKQQIKELSAIYSLNKNYKEFPLLVPV